MKRTEIHYQKTANDYIRVIKVKNAASSGLIAHEFGPDVCRLYYAKEPWYSGIDSTSVRIYNKSEDFLAAGTRYHRDQFQERIELMKIAGNRLTEIRKAVAGAAKNPVKVIKI